MSGLSVAAGVVSGGMVGPFDDVSVSQTHKESVSLPFVWNSSTRSSLFVTKGPEISIFDTAGAIPEKGRRKQSWSCPSWLLPDCLKKQPRRKSRSCRRFLDWCVTIVIL